ncbi:MAG: hypothetical protein ACO3EZ_02220 [Prochlorotrichaceae cyanobacterium]
MGSDFSPHAAPLDSSAQSKPHAAYCAIFEHWLNTAFQDLGKTVPATSVQPIAAAIVDCMTGCYRSFHTPEHILQVAEGGDAIEVLAALFHDVVYLQVDTCIPPAVSGVLSPFLLEDSFKIKPLTELNQDLDFALVATIFDVEQEEELPPQQNEFLSAIVAAKFLSPFLNRSSLAEIIACIEATIPFRVSGKEGVPPSDRLYHNLLTANQRFSLDLSPDSVVSAVKRAVRLANRDVKNFADVEASYFLDNTWKLLPETNPPLRNPEAYTPHQYRCALQKMVGFMDFLAPTLVFRQFQGEPSPQDYEGMLDRAAKNMDVARLYLKAKLVALAFVEALNEPEQDETPLVNLVGHCQKPAPDTSPTAFSASRQSQIQAEVMQLLEFGRNQETAFDIRHSPLAALLARTYGFTAMSEWFDSSQEFFAQNLSAEAFLALHDSGVVNLCLNYLTS